MKNTWTQLFKTNDVISYALFNLYHSLGIFSRRQTDDIFSYFS